MTQDRASFESGSARESRRDLNKGSTAEAKRWLGDKGNLLCHFGVAGFADALRQLRHLLQFKETETVHRLLDFYPFAEARSCVNPVAPRTRTNQVIRARHAVRKYRHRLAALKV